MNRQRTATGKSITALVIVVVVAALAFGAYGLTKSSTVETSYGTSTTTYTTTVYKNVEMVGTCTAVSYIIPDYGEVSVTNVTVTSGTATTYSLSTITVSPAGETTLGTTKYSTSTYENNTAIYTTTSTSQNLNDIPSNGWTVTTCTFAPTG
jgi:uncharacterized membrane protein YuzA (DUF378 family)